MNVYLSTTQRLVRSAKGFARRRLHIPTKDHPVESTAIQDTAALAATKTAKQRAPRGTATVGVDRDVLRIQMPSHLSKALWGQTQKYVYLGLSDTPENRLVVELVLRDIQLDLYADCVDVTCERYLQAAAAYKPQKPQQPQQPWAFPSNMLPAFLKKETVLSLFEKYLKYKKSSFAETTVQEGYRRYRRYLSKCPQDLDEGLEIQSYLTATYAPCRARRIIGVIAASVEWGKLNRLIPADFVNVYRQYKKILYRFPNVKQRHQSRH